MRGSLALSLLFSASAFAATPAAPARPSAAIPSAESIAAMVPASGKLSERELILMAISQRPDLEKLRGAIATATALKRAARDLENPELRLSYAQDRDDRIDDPYTEYETLRSSTSETATTITGESSLSIGAGGVGTAKTSTGAETSLTNKNRTRVIEREVTPGATKDVIVERVYETNSSTSSSRFSEAELKGTTPTNTEGTKQEREKRRLVGTTRREILHPDVSGRDNALGIMLRLKLPHPWERKARIQRAAAEISLAEAEYYAGEDTVVRTVRKTFQELGILQGKLTAQNARKTGHEAYRDWLESRNTPKLGLDLAAARAKVHGCMADIRSLEDNIATMRGELAAYCGLTDANRIDTTSKTRLIYSPSTLDVEYLTSIAMLYRSDVLGDQARLAIAQAELAEVNARRIPFSTFVDFGYTEVESLRRSGMRGEWFGRVGVSIPLWDWIGVNKKHKVFEATQQSLGTKIELQRRLIAAEISQAVKRLAAAEAQLSSQDKDLAELKADMKKSMNDAQMATLDVDDLAKAKRIDQEFADLTQQFELSRFTSLSAYQDALMALEKALGIRLERALSRTHTP
ncbi:MAG: TolC family protein [Prosthecobacter sp.]|uniref:TolC family protein n=1 Tax=Prosthecobacter sp. TaxID=1965333 RepID=UPI0039010559